MLAEVIREVHDASRHTYGARRVHAELVLGRQMTVARCTVELVMRRLGLAGLPGRPRYRKGPNTPTAEDLVNRDFARADTAAEMLIVFGDNPQRVRSEAAFAKLCGACPIPASSGITNKHRLYRGGHPQANAALHRTVIVRMRFHQPTIDYVARRTAEGLSKRDIIRCLKRFLAREVYQRVMTDHTA